MNQFENDYLSQFKKGYNKATYAGFVVAFLFFFFFYFSYRSGMVLDRLTPVTAKIL